ncbi:hypothetical protein [Pseudomonas fluorescens]|uniref:hypothetical protein n=1 Tax=Pseudomonas fluorescens TaxID=294 RepID=UPI0005C581C6|nr:hypothetical protein [Pseudomonas fluorescens]
MTTNQTIDGVLLSRALLERIISHCNFWHDHPYLEAIQGIDKELRALLDAESAPCAQPQVEGRRERFQKWVMATKHPVFGFLDGRSLARGDDRTGYADEYVQGLWVAYLEFGAEQPAPVAVVLPERVVLRDIIAKAIGGDAYDCTRVWSAWGVGTMSDDDFIPIVDQEERLYEIADACLDEVTSLNPKSR